MLFNHINLNSKIKFKLFKTLSSTTLLFFTFTHIAFADDAQLNEVFRYEYSLFKNNTPQTKASLTSDEIIRLYRATYSHPVANFNVLGYYDPTEAIGFCFGRAMAADLLARKLGLAQSKIKKLWVIGDLRSRAAVPEWRFHVTTTVEGPDGKRYAIDPAVVPMFGGRFPTESQWMQKVVQTWDSYHRQNPKAYFYYTTADAIVPDIRIMRDTGQEIGDRIMELSFAPNSKPGLTQVGPRVFEVDPANQIQHFIGMSEHGNRTGGEGFNLAQITINQNVYHYRNYFFDLLNFEFRGVRPRFDQPILRNESLGRPMQSLESTTPRPIVPGGMLFHRLK